MIGARDPAGPLSDSGSHLRKGRFSFARQSGDHLIYTKPDVKRPLVIPAYRSVPVFIIRNLLRTCGMSRDRYFTLLDQ